MSWGLEAVQDLAMEYETCTRCPVLCETRTGVIIGGGNVRADLMIIGEAPGAEEDDAGVPFIGRGGRLLMEIFFMKWPRTEEILDIDEIPNTQQEKFFQALRDYLDDHIFWTNIIACWPGETKRSASAKEIKACKERLHRLIYAVDPMLIIATGGTAVSALVGKKIGVVTNRGTIFDIEVVSPSTGRPVRYPVMALLHPGYLLKKGDQSLVADKKGETWNTMEDIEYAMTLLEEQYQTLFGTSFPDRPLEYKREL